MARPSPADPYDFPLDDDPSATSDASRSRSVDGPRSPARDPDHHQGNVAGPSAASDASSSRSVDGHRNPARDPDHQQGNVADPGEENHHVDQSPVPRDWRRDSSPASFLVPIFASDAEQASDAEEQLLKFASLLKAHADVDTGREELPLSDDLKAAIRFFELLCERTGLMSQNKKYSHDKERLASDHRQASTLTNFPDYAKLIGEKQTDFEKKIADGFAKVKLCEEKLETQICLLVRALGLSVSNTAGEDTSPSRAEQGQKSKEETRAATQTGVDEAADPQTTSQSQYEERFSTMEQALEGLKEYQKGMEAKLAACLDSNARLAARADSAESQLIALQNSISDTPSMREQLDSASQQHKASIAALDEKWDEKWGNLQMILATQSENWDKARIQLDTLPQRCTALEGQMQQHKASKDQSEALVKEFIPKLKADADEHAEAIKIFKQQIPNLVSRGELEKHQYMMENLERKVRHVPTLVSREEFEKQQQMIGNLERAVQHAPNMMKSENIKMLEQWAHSIEQRVNNLSSSINRQEFEEGVNMRRRIQLQIATGGFDKYAQKIRSMVRPTQDVGDLCSNRNFGKIAQIINTLYQDVTILVDAVPAKDLEHHLNAIRKFAHYLRYMQNAQGNNMIVQIYVENLPKLQELGYQVLSSMASLETYAARVGGLDKRHSSKPTVPPELLEAVTSITNDRMNMSSEKLEAIRDEFKVMVQTLETKIQERCSTDHFEEDNAGKAAERRRTGTDALHGSAKDAAVSTDAEALHEGFPQPSDAVFKAIEDMNHQIQDINHQIQGIFTWQKLFDGKQIAENIVASLGMARNEPRDRAQDGLTGKKRKAAELNAETSHNTTSSFSVPTGEHAKKTRHSTGTIVESTPPSGSSVQTGAGVSSAAHNNGNTASNRPRTRTFTDAGASGRKTASKTLRRQSKD